MRISDWSSDVCSSDLRALHAARHWTPTAAVSGADGLWLDLTGTTHLFGGEARFAARLVSFLRRIGFTARVAIAGTPGAAHALARFGGAATIVLPEGTEGEALGALRSEEHTSELQSLMRISYAVFCLKKKNKQRSYTKKTENIST